MLLLAQALAILPLSLAATYTLNHRWIAPHSGQESVPFVKYATVDLPDSHDVTSIVRLEGSDSEMVIERGDGGLDGWYQVQLVGEGLAGGALSSMQACYFTYGTPSLTIHQHPPKAPSSIHLNPPASVPLDGICAGLPDTVTIPRIEREVTIRTPHLAFGPDLAPPVPLNPAGPDGKPAPPVEEKSFLQKYWLPLLGVGFFLISQMAPEDPKQAAAAGGERAAKAK